MIVYNYDAETKEFLYSSKAQINPMKKGSFLIPANSTTVEVIEEKEGFARVFENNSWSYVIDFRNSILYNTENSFIEENYKKLGPLPDNLTEKTPPEKYPKWTGTEWVVDTEKLLKEKVDAKLINLKKKLEDSDYKIIKSFENSLLNLEIEYDLQALHEERQLIRDEINKLSS